MCEWLLSGEWCDVKLVCGGKTFNAHRVVLASVSVFLRRVLLSCPQEDTPVFVVLPDFDLEAMSSVLYYVYNGEVFIDNTKLFMFLDIIKTLEIFIDYQYLHNLRDGVYDRCLDQVTNPKSKCLEDVCAMSSRNCNENESINTEIAERFHDKRHQYLLSKTVPNDKKDKYLNLSDLHPSVPNMDRQRNSYLRDLYIESYPQNGNFNGVTGDVLAISNEDYRAQTSILLTNANEKLPIRADDSISDIRRNLTERDYLSNLVYCKQNGVKGFDQAYNNIYIKSLLDTAKRASSSKSNSLRSHGYNNLGMNYNKPLISYKASHKYIALHKGGIQESIPMASLDLSLAQSLVRNILPNPYQNTNEYVDTIRLMQCNLNNVHKKMNTDEKGSITNLSKVPIFNQVIDSPWRPRLPNNYKPFKRKNTHVTDLVLNKKEKTIAVNDTNNNSVNNDNVEYKTESNNQCEDTTTVNVVELKCSICNQVFISKDCLAAHVRRHTVATSRYSCGECGKTFSQLRNFKYHVSVHRGTREFAATCTVCGKYFNDRGYLSSHMKIHRNRKEYKCSFCPKSFNQRVAYNMHVRIHTGIKPHVCGECGKAFSRKMLLKQHQRTHSGERPYACPHCDKRFADRSNMTLHLRLHTGVKPFSCSLCPKSFTKKHHLKSHLNFHTGAKPYSCPRCKLAFTQSSNMRTHLKKCTVPPEDILLAI